MNKVPGPAKAIYKFEARALKVLLKWGLAREMLIGLSSLNMIQNIILGSGETTRLTLCSTWGFDFLKEERTSDELARVLLSRGRKDCKTNDIA